jgi:hypothetical protein
VPMPHVYMSGYQPIPMQAWTDVNTGNDNLAMSLEARLSQLSSLQRQTVLAHLAATDARPDTTSSSSPSFPPHEISSNSMPRPSNLEAILGMISTLSPTETRALAAYISRSSGVNQLTPADMAWVGKPSEDQFPPPYGW